MCRVCWRTAHLTELILFLSLVILAPQPVFDQQSPVSRCICPSGRPEVPANPPPPFKKCAFSWSPVERKTLDLDLFRCESGHKPNALQMAHGKSRSPPISRLLSVLERWFGLGRGGNMPGLHLRSLSRRATCPTQGKEPPNPTPPIPKNATATAPHRQRPQAISFSICVR